MFVIVKCPVTICTERLRCTEQSGVVNMSDVLLVLQTDKNRGEGSRLMLAALWQPVPWNMPCSIFSTWIQFSAAHTLQQQRGGEALDSVQLQLFKKKKRGGSLVSDELGSLQHCSLGTPSRAGTLKGHHQGRFLYTGAPQAGQDQLTPAHPN